MMIWNALISAVYFHLSWLEQNEKYQIICICIAIFTFITGMFYAWQYDKNNK